MATVRDLINGSLRLLGVLAQGEVAEAAEAQDALASLNSLLYSWATKRLYAMPERAYLATLTTSQSTYSFGPGGDVDIPKPVNIRNMALLQAGQFTSLSEVNLDGFTALSESAYVANGPQAYRLNYQPTVVQVSFTPQPAIGTQVRFYTWDEYQTINDVLTLPLGFEKAVRYNLAVELAPEYGVTVPQIVADRATAAKADIASKNVADSVIPTTRTGPPSVRDLISSSLRLLGVLQQGQTIDAYQAQGGLKALNTMLDSWSTESLSVMGMNPHIVTLANAQQSYTVGPGGDINIPRPVLVQDVSAVYPTGPQAVFIPLDEYTLDQYSAIPVIGYQAPIPWAYYMNYSFPLNVMNFYPIPQAGTQLRFYTMDTIAEFADINAVVNLAPGYEKALRFNLALELASEYGKDPAATVVVNARESKSNIQRLNADDLILACENSFYNRRFGAFNYLVGGPTG